MPRFLLRLDDDLFVEWSTVVDAPVTYGMTLAELREHLESKHDHAPGEIDERIERTLRKGVSSHLEESARDAIICNRAGPREKTLTWDELVAMVRRETGVAAAIKKATGEGP